MADRYTDLVRLTDPANAVAMAIFRYSFRTLGISASRYLAIVSGYLILIVMFSLGSFALLSIFRFLRQTESK